MNDDKATGLYTEFEGKGIGATEIGKDKPILSDFELPRRAVKSLGEGFTTLIKDSEAIAAQMDDSITDIVNTMGQGKGFAESMRANIAKSVPEIVLMGGEFSDVEKIAVDTLDTLGRNVQLNEKEYEQIFATTKITGESTKNLQEAFANSGKSIKDIAKEMFDVVNIANSLGANAKAVSKDVVANMQQLNRFGFEGGINGLAKMAAQASILRIDMGEVFQFAEDAMSPEKAIEFSSALQRLGAVSSELVDPLKLMDLSQNNVPQLQKELGTLFKQYAKFDETTKQFKIAPGARLTLKQLEQDLGIPLDQIEKMAIASADMERKMKDIDLSQFALDEETATLVTSMAKMGEGGEYVIETKTAEGDPIQKSIEEFVSDFGGDSEAIKKFVQDREEEEGKSIDEQILERAEGQLSMLKSIDQQMKASSMAKALTVGGGELGANMLKLNQEMVKKITEPAIETFGPNSGLYKAINKTGQNLDDAIELLKKKDTSKLGGATKEIAKTMALTGAYGVDETFEGAEKLFEFSPLIQAGINGIQTVTNQALNVILQTAGISDQDQITFKQQVETKDALISTETDSSIIVVNELGKIGQVLKPDPQDVVGVMPKEGMNQFMDAVDKPKVIDKTKEANNYTSLLESESLKNNINISNQTSNQNLDYVTNLTNNVNTNYENLKRTLNSFAENLNKTTTINYNTNNTELKKTQNVEEIKKDLGINSKEISKFTNNIEKTNVLSNNVEEIKKDLGINPKEISKFTNNIEKTNVLSNQVSELNVSTIENESSLLTKLSQEQVSNLNRLVNLNESIINQSNTKNIENEKVSTSLTNQVSELNVSTIENESSLLTKLSQEQLVNLTQLVNLNKIQKVSEIIPNVIEKTKTDEKIISFDNMLEKYMGVMNTNTSVNFEGGKIDLNFNHTVKIEGVNELTSGQLIGPLKSIFEKNQGGIGNIVQQNLQTKLKFGQDRVSSKNTPYFQKPIKSR